MGKEFAKWQAPTENKKMDNRERKTGKKRLDRWKADNFLKVRLLLK